jgi:hypothetical protein
MDVRTALPRDFIGIAMAATVIVRFMGVIAMFRGQPVQRPLGQQADAPARPRAGRGGGVARRPHGGDVRLSN